MLSLRVSACLQLQNGLLVLLLAVAVELHPLEGFGAPSSMLSWFDMMISSAQFLGETVTDPRKWRHLLQEWKTPSLLLVSPATLHWLQLQSSTLHQPQSPEGAIASSHFLGFLSVTPPSAYFFAPSLGSGHWWAFCYREALIALK